MLSRLTYSACQKPGDDQNVKHFATLKVLVIASDYAN